MVGKTNECILGNITKFSGFPESSIPCSFLEPIPLACLGWCLHAQDLKERHLLQDLNLECPMYVTEATWVDGSTFFYRIP